MIQMGRVQPQQRAPTPQRMAFKLMLTALAAVGLLVIMWRMLFPPARQVRSVQRGKLGREKIQTQLPSPPLISGTSPPLTLGICCTWGQTQTAPGDLQDNQVNVTMPMIQVQSRHKEKRDVAHNFEDNWRQELAEKNEWYKWMAYSIQFNFICSAFYNTGLSQSSFTKGTGLRPPQSDSGKEKLPH